MTDPLIEELVEIKNEWDRLTKTHCSYEEFQQLKAENKVLQEKLDVAVQALEKYANKFNWCDCKIKLGIDGFGIKSEEIKASKACYQIQGFSEAQEVLAKIKEIK